MSDSTSAVNNIGAVSTDEDPGDKSEQVFDAEYVKKLRDENAKYRTRAKANEDAAKRLAELEEAAKTAEQKQAERTAALEAKVRAYETKEQVSKWKKEVSKDTNIPAAALAGATFEEIQAHAETLKSLGLGQEAAKTPAEPVPTIGKEPIIPGNVTIDAQIRAAQTAGNAELVGALKAMKLGSKPAE